VLQVTQLRASNGKLARSCNSCSAALASETRRLQQQLLAAELKAASAEEVQQVGGWGGGAEWGQPDLMLQLV
jgi:hypothetical protein